MRSVIDVVDLSVSELDELLDTACDIIKRPKKYSKNTHCPFCKNEGRCRRQRPFAYFIRLHTSSAYATGSSKGRSASNSA